MPVADSRTFSADGAFLLRLSDALRAEPNAEAIADCALRMLLEHMRLDRCYVGIYRLAEDTADLPHQVHIGGLYPLPAHLRLSDFPEALQVAVDRTLVIDDAMEIKGLSDSDRAGFDGLGVRALIAATLRKGENNPLWAIVAASACPRIWTPAEVSLVEEVAERTWTAMERARDQSALHSSESRLRALFDAVDQGYMEVEVEMSPEGRAIDWRYVTLNPSFHRLTGMEDVTGRLVSEVAPELEPEWGERYTQVVTSGESMRFVLPVAALGRWFDVNLINVGGAGSRRIAVVYDDVTERMRAEAVLRGNEARQAFLLKLSDALRAEPDAKAVAERALRMLFEHLALDRCYVVIYRPEANQAVFPHQIHDDSLSPLPPHVPLSDFPKGLALVSEQTLVIDDIAETEGLSALDRANIEALGVRALLNATLRKGGNNPLWAIAAASKHPRTWTRSEISLVEDVAERTWAAVERARSEAALLESDTRLRELNATLEERITERTTERNRVWSTSRGLLMIADLNGVFRAVNPAWTRTLGYTEAETIGRSYHDFIVPDDVQPTVDATLVAASGIDVDGFENRYRHKDGSIRRLAWNTSAEEGLIYAFGRDVTDERAREAEKGALEEQLRQARKMEAMGSLTGGVAHDFNNLLTPILGSLDMLHRKGLGNEREQRLIAGALQSADRAKMLVQRLLAFARRQPLQTTSVDLGPLVHDMAELIRSTTGPQVKVVVDAGKSLPPAHADPNQLEMAILNLAVNARDAMPEGGTLRISIEEETVGRQHRSNVTPGRYLRLSVADTGSGMDEETLSRAVEPFYSTKGVGKGTGLGLSMVHGLASQLGGGLLISSTPEIGTNIELWLPQSAEPLACAQPESQASLVLKGKGTALLVDDEDLVRLSTADMLIELGYSVVEAASAEEALKLVDNGLQPDVLVTDHLMPGMTGTDLARLLQGSQPFTKVLVVSGYAEADGVAPDLPRLTKPFRSVDLAASLASLG